MTIEKSRAARLTGNRDQYRHKVKIVTQGSFTLGGVLPKLVLYAHPCVTSLDSVAAGIESQRASVTVTLHVSSA